MIAIMKRDLRSFFTSPIGYVFLAVFLLVSNYFFYSYNISGGASSLSYVFASMLLILVFLIPLVTMRLMSEEMKQRTDQMLLTAPVRVFDIVLGKYLAAASVMLLTILLTNVYTLIIAICGKVYMGEWFVGYLGFILQSLGFLAIDLFVSSFAKNQITGAVAAFGVNFLLWMADLVADHLPFAWMQETLHFLSLYDRYEPFRLGQLSFSGVLFFIRFIGCCVAASVHVMGGGGFWGGGGA